MTQATQPAPSLNTTLVTAAGTWAVAVMGGSAAQYNDFWQLFIRPAGTTRWQLVTPPGTADNGGLVLAGGGQSLVTAFRPSQNLTYSPLIETRDAGQAWSSLSPLDAALASTPDALAIKPGSGTLLALLAGGTAELAAPGYTTWTTLASQQTLAATPPAGAAGCRTSPPPRSPRRGSPCSPAPAPAPEPPASSPPGAGPGRQQDPRSPPPSPASTSRSCG